MNRLLWVLLLAFCLLVVDAKKKTAEPVKNDETPAPAEEDSNADDETDEEQEPKGAEEKTDDDKDEKKEEVAENKDEDKDEAQTDDNSDTNESNNDESEESESAAATPQCNLKFKRVGCYVDNPTKKGEHTLHAYLMKDAGISAISKKGDLPKNYDHFNKELPKFACKCANEAITAGNAVFGLQNLAECWTGPDDSKYDKDGASDECVSFNLSPCGDAEICTGKKKNNFVYYVDTPEHTKTKEEINKEYKDYERKIKAYHRKKASKKLASKKLTKKKVKKVKKE